MAVWADKTKIGEGVVQAIAVDVVEFEGDCPAEPVDTAASRVPRF